MAVVLVAKVNKLTHKTTKNDCSTCNLETCVLASLVQVRKKWLQAT